MEMIIIAFAAVAVAGMALYGFLQWLALGHRKLREDSDARINARELAAFESRMDVFEGSLKNAMVETREKIEEHDARLDSILADARTDSAIAAGAASNIADRQWGR